ncbi:hypothetical protein [uncultured Novosphingobium sp.]|uniref:hypothetical protein n=1 Tax=uncultured Novosphingobium sp. TaxID=292277 RepID=UPI002585E30D|nr:hypothetical protein [uncultured Novosphingobium sp.]
MKREPITLEAHLERLEQRRAALRREVAVPRNSGTRRTASKRALLAAIEATGAKW